jgi:hypothetical protein
MVMAMGALRRAVGVVSVCVLVGVVVCGCAAAALAAGDANQGGCPPETEASPGFRSYLPDCRAYELVSPPYKQGGVIQVEATAVSASGEDLIIGTAAANGAVENASYDPNRGGDVDVYHLTRTGAGWQYTALTPPAAQYSRSTLLAVSADPTLGTTLWGAQTAARYYYHEEDIYMQTGAGGLAPVGPGLAPGFAGNDALGYVSLELGLVGASSDLTRSVYTIQGQEVNGHSDLWPGDTTRVEASTGGGHSLYEYVYGGSPNVEPVLVGVRNHGVPASNKEAQLISSCGTELGSPPYERGSAYNAVSADGEIVYFTALACGSSPAVDELYARIGASATVAVSEPSKSDCEACNTTTGLQGASFAGASQDGSKVFFMTEQELLPGQSGMNLYEYDFSGQPASAAHPDGKISLVSGGSGSPEVQGVARVAEDGSRVYFVAKGVLARANAEGKSPEAGAENLYVYDTQTGRTVFVARLLTSAEEATLRPEESAEATLVNERAEEAAFAAQYEAISRGASSEEAFEKLIEAYTVALQTLSGTLGPSGTLAADRSVWQTADRRPVQATPDGRFLVFLSSADLTADDTSTVPQLFEYDAAQERLTRVSIGQGGVYDSNGNASAFHDAPQIPEPSFTKDLPTTAQSSLAVSEDGSEVFFTSAASLTPAAVSGAPSVFEYRAGDVYLISDGRDASDAGTGTPSVGLLGVDASGRDVLFTTANQLVPQSGDTQLALYDAREGGGFPAPVLPAGCVGETCRGAVAPAVGPVVPGSTTQGAGDNLPPAPAGKPAARGRSLSRAQRLARALRVCARLPRRQRAGCRARARRRYGQRSGASGAGRSRTAGNRHVNGRSR